MIRCYIIWRNNHAYDQRLRRFVDRANVACYGTSVPRLKFRWLILLAYAMAHSDFGEVVGE